MTRRPAVPAQRAAPEDEAAWREWYDADSASRTIEQDFNESKYDAMRRAFLAARASARGELLGYEVVLRSIALRKGECSQPLGIIAGEDEALRDATAAANHMPVVALVCELRVVRRVTG